MYPKFCIVADRGMISNETMNEFDDPKTRSPTFWGFECATSK